MTSPDSIRKESKENTKILSTDIRSVADSQKRKKIMLWCCHQFNIICPNV